MSIEYCTKHLQNTQFFSSVHGTFSRTDDILESKTSFNKYKKIEITCILSDHDGLKLEINRKRITEDKF
jgi:hypothetical protein